MKSDQIRCSNSTDFHWIIWLKGVFFCLPHFISKHWGKSSVFMLLVQLGSDNSVKDGVRNTCSCSLNAKYLKLKYEITLTRTKPEF